MAFPLPFTTAFLAGFFTLAGVWIASRLTSSREHRRWISDNKKLEWRELIDQMHESFNRIQYAYISPPGVYEASDDSFDPRAGIQAGERVLRNRIFIADTLLRHGITEHWEQLRNHTQKLLRSNSGSDLHELEMFLKQRMAFEAKLLEAARVDLGLAVGTSIWNRWFRRFGTRG
jgi:hypothetical protein